jgi:hypothetical protein
MVRLDPRAPNLLGWAFQACLWAGRPWLLCGLLWWGGAVKKGGAVCTIIKQRQLDSQPAMAPPSVHHL